MTSRTIAHWLPIDSNVFDADEIVTRKGVEFHVFLSPYDLPEAVRGRVDAATHHFVVEFRYLGDEGASLITIDKDVTFQVGVKSRRLQRIELNINGLGASQVAVRIDNAIDSLASQLNSTRVPRANFEVAKNVLHRKQPELLANVG